MEKVIWASALSLCNSFAAKCFNSVFPDQEVNNYKHRYELWSLLQGWEYIDWVMITLTLRSVDMRAAHEVTRLCAVSAGTPAFVLEG